MTQVAESPATGEHHGRKLVTSPDLSVAMARAARDWLDLLRPEQRRIVLWPFGSPERGNWHYAPRDREGLALRSMDEQQRAGAYRLLESGLSAGGYGKARAILALETVLLEIERGRGPLRDPLNYAFTLFGEPGTCPWGWRIEGHHLIINATIAAPDAVTVTPTFWGTNPARIPHGPREGERIMAREYHLGLELARSLDGQQRRVAVFQERSVGNIITERGRAQDLQEPTGLPFGRLSDGQQELATSLIHEYVGNAANEFGEPYWDRVRGHGLERIRFAWAGGMTEGQAFYYRIHAPLLLIEFDCTQNDANHIHSVWRDPSIDWGRDLLGEHYHHQHDHD